MPTGLKRLAKRLTRKETEVPPNQERASTERGSTTIQDRVTGEIAIQSKEMREAGMATAEYAIATVAACGFAALLVVILKSDAVRSTLLSIVQHALSLGG